MPIIFKQYDIYFENYLVPDWPIIYNMIGIILIQHLYLSCMRLGVAPNNKYNKHLCLQGIGLHAQNMIIFLGSIIVTINKGSYMTI